MYTFILIKRWLEDVVLYPFILLGRLMALAKPLGGEYEVFYFFSFYHIGGAEKVHAQIVQATGNGKGIVFFTRKPHNDLFYKAYEQTGCRIIDISGYTDNKWLYFLNCIWRGVVSGYINRQKMIPLVFNGQCNFGYKLSPWIKKEVPQVELIHSFNTFSSIRLPFISFYRRTVMISKVRIGDHNAQYDRLHVPDALKARIEYIPNGIKIPTLKQRDYTKSPLRILYVGRATAEKRVHLVGKIAESCSLNKIPAEFMILGEVKNAMPEKYHPFCIFLGNLNDEDNILEVYEDADILLITSTTEGFPMVIMEAMACGLVIISTTVGDVPLHVKNSQNGLVIDEVKDEEIIVEKASLFIRSMINKRELFWEASVANRKYAEEHFGIDRFDKAWQELFTSLKPTH